LTANYDIKKLLEDIYTSDWFYAEKNIGNKIKSPIELLAGIRRMLPLELDNDQSQLIVSKNTWANIILSSNVAGWAGWPKLDRQQHPYGSACRYHRCWRQKNHSRSGPKLMMM
jgi:hypothetical protein